MAIYRLNGETFDELQETSLAAQGILERKDLQAAVRRQIDVVCPDCLVIAEEFAEWSDSQRRIDLLAIDKAANIVVVELKRGDTGKHMELQALRYAAMVSTLTFKRAVEILGKYLKSCADDRDAEETLLSFLSWEEPQDEDFASDVRITLVAEDFSREITTTVLWLNQRGLDIRCVRLQTYEHKAEVLVDVQQIIPLPEAEAYQVKVREQQAARREARSSGRDYTRYQFEGAVYNKRRLVLSVVKRWVAEHKPDTLDELLEAFPQDIRRTGMFLEADAAIEIAERQGIRRHFIGDGEIVDLPTSGRYAISNQWGAENLEVFLEHARRLGFSIEEAR